MLSRRSLLSGLFAAPAVVACASLMPLRGYVYNPIIRVQSWPIGTEPVGEWWAHEGPLSRIDKVEDQMREMFGKVYVADRPKNIIVSGLNSDGCSEANSPICPKADVATSEMFPDGVFRFGTAHGVPRIDPPVMSDDELRMCRERNGYHPVPYYLPEDYCMEVEARADAAAQALIAMRPPTRWGS